MAENSSSQDPPTCTPADGAVLHYEVPAALGERGGRENSAGVPERRFPGEAGVEPEEEGLVETVARH